MARYVALLRGINVGGKNLVPMRDLREAFEQAGYADVSTYIQSGNVLFTTTASKQTLETTIEKALEARFGYPLVVVVRSHTELRNVVDKAPKGFGKQPDTYHCDVVFLRAPLTSSGAMSVVQTRDEVDEAWAGTGVIYFARLSSRRTESKMGKFAGTPEYKLMTIRNWSTTTKLLALLDG